MDSEKFDWSPYGENVQEIKSGRSSVESKNSVYGDYKNIGKSEASN